MLYALNANGGQVRWRFPTTSTAQNPARIRSSPLALNSIIYFGAWDGFIYALHASDGSQQWRYRTLDIVDSSPVSGDGALYIGSNDHYLYAITL